MDVLSRHKYDIAKAVAAMVPPGGPVICRDQLEEWSASEANLFEEALEKYGKDFNDIRQDFVSRLKMSNMYICLLKHPKSQEMFTKLIESHLILCHGHANKKFNYYTCAVHYTSHNLPHYGLQRIEKDRE